MICGSGHTASVWNAKIGVPRQAPKNLRPSDKLTPNPRSGSGSFDFINHTRIPRWGGPSSADECWRLSGECGRWAAESGDNATRAAFRQMAKVWAQLAFSLNFTPPRRNEPVGPGNV
jgi:hypothetical protein